MPSKLQEFTDQFSERFSSVYYSDIEPDSDCIVVRELSEIPEFTPVHYQSNGVDKMVYHRAFQTNFEKTEEKASSQIIRLIKRFADSVIPENHDYKHYRILWRIKPTTKLHNNEYIGFSRLSIIAEG